jgi:hypothetical protein
MWTGCEWLGIHSRIGLLWWLWWSFRFHNSREFVNIQIEWLKFVWESLVEETFLLWQETASTLLMNHMSGCSHHSHLSWRLSDMSFGCGELNMVCALRTSPHQNVNTLGPDFKFIRPCSLATFARGKFLQSYFWTPWNIDAWVRYFLCVV